MGVLYQILVTHPLYDAVWCVATESLQIARIVDGDAPYFYEDIKGVSYPDLVLLINQELCSLASWYKTIGSKTILPRRESYSNCSY